MPRRGFAAISRKRNSEIASQGGKAAHKQGRAHEYSSAEARVAGHLGGRKLSRDREHMSAIGRKGGQTRVRRLRERGRDSEPSLAPQLEELARHLHAAVDALLAYLGSVPARAPFVPRSERATKASKPAKSADETQTWPWERILPAAESLLQAEPLRSWKPIEFAKALRAGGLKLKTYRGLHFAIGVQLREAGLIVQRKNGTFTARRKQALATSTKPARRPAPTPAKPEESRDAANDGLVKAARTALEAEPERSWTPIELVREIRASGLARASWRGVHFYLPKILRDAALIETRAGGQFTASREETTAASEENKEPEPVQDPAVLSLAQEVETLAPRLAGMTPRERTARLAVWAGRARQLHDEQAKPGGNRVNWMRGSMRAVAKRLIELRHSLDCGWVDALTSDWSTDWRIYIECNRAVAASDQPSLSNDEKKIYLQDVLRSLLEHRKRTVSVKDASPLIIEAAQVLDETDPWLVEATKKFGRQQDRRAEEGAPAEPYRRREDADDRSAHANALVKKQGVPKSVLRETRGKKLLIAGGRGTHETQRLAVKKGLQLKTVDWITGERHPSPAALFSLAVENKKYDFVLLVSSTEISDTQALVAACKKVGSRLFHLTGAPSIPSVAEAIFAHHIVGGRLPEWMETR